MNAVLSFVQAHPNLTTGLVGYWVVMAAADAMPAPDATSGKLYVFGYRLIHFVAANLSKALPQSESKQETK